MRGLLVITAVLTAIVGPRAWSQAPEAEIGLTGYVLAPDELPVTTGTLHMPSGGSDVVANVGPAGRFRIVPNVAGLHDLYVSAPQLMTHRLKVVVPLSRTFAMPPIRMAKAAYLQVRFLSPAGEPLSEPWVVRQSFDISGLRLWEPRTGRAADEAAPDGTTLIGPLPRGVTTLVVDAPPFARMRLPDVRVTGESPLIDGGVVKLEPGAVLSVDVVDAAGAPVVGHEVYLDEIRPFSPIGIPPQRTNAEGRATFDRLASGRYRLRTRTHLPCGNRFLRVGRTIDAPGAGSLRRRLVIGGRAPLRVTSGSARLIATIVSLTPDSPAPARAPWLRGAQSSLPSFGPFNLSGETPCTGTTDGSGLVTLTSVPPGPARVAVRLPHATWVRRIEVSEHPREIAVDVPSGVMSVRALRADTRAPVGGAEITWTSGGARVETRTSATGDALLDGVALSGGMLAVAAPGYIPFQQRLASPPDVLHEIALQPAGDESAHGRIVNETGEPLAGAVVELIPTDPIEDSHVATTDARGSVRFLAAPPGAARLVVRADRYVVSTVPVPSRMRGPITITLSRGYRILARVERTVGAGPHRIRLLDAAGAARDHFLDAASDRVIDRPQVASLGPLPPGTYIVELRGAAETERRRVHIAGRDAHVTFQ